MLNALSDSFVFQMQLVLALNLLAFIGEIFSSINHCV